MQKLNPGMLIKVHAYKHNGIIYREWSNCTVIDETNDFYIFANNNNFIREKNGQIYKTKDLAIWFLSKHEWFNTIAIISDNEITWYTNIASPAIYDGEVIKFIDYDIDLRLYENGEYIIKDVDEYFSHKEEHNYHHKICEAIKNTIKEILAQAKNKQTIFNIQYVNSFVNSYYEKNL